MSKGSRIGLLGIRHITCLLCLVPDLHRPAARELSTTSRWSIPCSFSQEVEVKPKLFSISDQSTVENERLLKSVLVDQTVTDSLYYTSKRYAKPKYD
jgi:hypothetical protein